MGDYTKGISVLGILIYFLRQHFGIKTKILYTIIIPFLALPFLPELSIWFSARWSRCANNWCVVNSADASENRANVASYIADVLTLYTQCLFSLLDRENSENFLWEKFPGLSIGEMKQQPNKPLSLIDLPSQGEYDHQRISG